MKVKITQIEQDWMVIQEWHQQCGWILEVEDDVASRWDYATKKYFEMQHEIETAFKAQTPKHEHFK